jgi:hypothetical protein
MPRGRPRKKNSNNPPQVPSAYKLALNQWLLSLFNVKRFQDLARHQPSEALEGPNCARPRVGRRHETSGY